MIVRLNGIVIEWSLEKDAVRAVVDVHGVGYEVRLPQASAGALVAGRPVLLHVVESVTAYDGASTLYGFVSKEEKAVFDRIRENVGGVGPKKAIEIVDKVSKSLPDFKRAVLEGDVSLLVSVFGFTKKMADKLVFSLKGKLDAVSLEGAPRWPGSGSTGTVASQVISGLVNLGYSDADAREMARRAADTAGGDAGVESVLQIALREAGKKATI